MPVMMASAAGLWMVPEGRPHDEVLCDDDSLLFICPRSIIESEWSLFLNAGVKVSVWVVVMPRLLLEFDVVRLLCESLYPAVLSDSGMNWSPYWLKMLNTTLPSYDRRVLSSSSPRRL